MDTHPVVQTFTIAITAATSDAKRVTGGVIVGLLMPAAFTGTTITFTASDTFGGTYGPVYDSDGNQVSLAVAASRRIGLSGTEADALSPWPFLKIVSGSNEAAERLVKITLR